MRIEGDQSGLRWESKTRLCDTSSQSPRGNPQTLWNPLLYHPTMHDASSPTTLGEIPVIVR